MTIHPMSLEKYLIHPDEWETCGAPSEALDLAKDESSQGVPTGLVKHPEHGWFVLQTSGQGPYIIWSENALDPAK